MLEATFRKDTETMSKILEEAHQLNVSIIKYNDENSLSYHIIVTGTYENQLFMQQVYEGASKYADYNCAVVELYVPQSQADDSSLQDLLDYCSYVNADGIIAYIDSPDENLSVLQRSEEVEIPLVTTGQFAAGFVCDLSDGHDHLLSKLTNSASITVENNDDNKPAGIVSQTHGDVVLSECINNGVITAKNEELGFAGGLISMVQTGSLEITNCKNNGTVKGNRSGDQISVILNGGGLKTVKVDSASAIGYINRHSGLAANSFNVIVDGVSYYGRFDGSMHSFQEIFNGKKSLDTAMFDTFRSFCSESGFETEAHMNNFEIFDLPFQTNSVNRRNYIYGNASDTDTSWDFALNQYNSKHPGNEISKETFKVSWDGNSLYQLDK